MPYREEEWIGPDGEVEYAPIKDYPEYADCIEYVWQRPCYGDCLEGEWWYADDENLVIYNGTFGNDHGPHAYPDWTVYDRTDIGRAEYAARVAELEAMPEYDPDADWGEGEDEDDDA